MTRTEVLLYNALDLLYQEYDWDSWLLANVMKREIGMTDEEILPIIKDFLGDSKGHEQKLKDIEEMLKEVDE